MNERAKHYVFACLTAVLVTLLGSMIYIHVCADCPNHIQIMDYYRQHAKQEMGVYNLVSSIYLGYRAYDTMGETFALVLAVVSGTFLARGTKSERL